MNYTLHQLQVFLKVTQCQSITKASQELHLSQPAVSIQLKNLQDQFEIPLTEVIGRKLYVTPFGKEIAVAAQNILNEVYEINYKTMVYKNQLAGRLLISVVSTGTYIMPYFLSEFMQKNKGIDLFMDVTNKSKVIDSLEKNETDFALVTVIPNQIQVESISLLENKLYLIGNQDQEFDIESNKKNILENLPLIYREAGSGTRFVMEKFMEENKISVRKKMELTSNEAVKQAVMAGLGLSIMPLIGLKNELSLGQLKVIPVEGFPIRSVWNLIWLKGKKFSPASKAFLEFLKTKKKEIVLEKFGWIESY